MDSNVAAQSLDTALMRSTIYTMLAKSFLYPTKQFFEFVSNASYEDALLGFQSLHCVNAELLGHVEEFRSVCSSLNDSRQREQHEADYNRLFAHLGSAKCPPYETEYGHENVFQKTEAMADIAGFYNAYGLEPSTTDTERVDFIGMEMEFMSFLALHEAYARDHDDHEHLDVCLDTQRKFLHDHLGRWVSVFARILSNSSSNAFYTWLGHITEYFIDSEARYLEVVLEKVTGPATMESQTPEPFGCEACITQEKLNEASG